MKGYSFRSLTDLVLKIFKTKVNAGTGLSGGGSLEADRTLTVKYGTIAGTAAQGDDGRLSNSREWTAATISQAETEAGTETTRRAFTAQRVRQAIVAWWNSITGVLGRDLVTSANATDARSKLGLGTAATRNVGETSGQVMQVGAFGLGGAGYADDDLNDKNTYHKFAAWYSGDAPVNGWDNGIYLTLRGNVNRFAQIGFSQLLGSDDFRIRSGLDINAAGSWKKVVHSGNTRQTTGTSTEFPMSQKAVTDQLATKAALSHTHPWSQVTGQPATATRWPTFAEVTGKPTIYATAWDSVAAKPAQATRWPTLAEVTGKPTNYPTNWATVSDKPAIYPSSWAAVSDKPVVQTVGTSTTNLMSQAAVTNALEIRSLSLRGNIKVTVGAGGAFPTINAAILHLSRFTPDLGVTATVELQSGFVMREQLLVEGLDLGWITITGVDAETVINEPSLTRSLVGGDKPAFGVLNGTLPTIGQLFRFSSKGSTADRRLGVMAYRLGRANISSGCGVKNAGLDGIYAAISSTINAQNAVASGAGRNGISADSGSTINAHGANASDAGQHGFVVYGGSIINAHSATGTQIVPANRVVFQGIIFKQ